MKFWKSNSYDIVRLFVIQIGMAIFGAVLSMPFFSVMKNLLPLVSAFSVCFYLYLIYAVAWETGAKEKVRVDAGRMPDRPNKGLFLMLYSQMLNYLLVFLMILGGILFMSGATVAGSRIYSIGYFPALFFSSMYFGILSLIEVSEGASYLYLTVGIRYLVAILPAIFTSWFGFRMGARNRHLISVSKKPPTNR